MAVRGGRLIVGAGEGARVLEVGPEWLLVGREPNCALVLADKKVSAVHFEVRATEHGVYLRDRSRNGTFCDDGTRIVEAYLQSPTVIRAGDTAIRYEPGNVEHIRLPDTDAFGPLIGATPAMRDVFRRLRKIAPTNLSILVLGETGSGKELVAQAVHQASPRAAGPFVVVDCGAIPAGLAESLLFGHEKGAFTGAVSRRQSPFVDARGGTVLLDELGELPLDLQPKLLRVLAERKVRPLGASRPIDIDVRVIAATRRDITADINDESFRSDLYFRIAQERIELPPLRARPDDIPLLVHHMLKSMGAGDAFRRIPPGTFERLRTYHWPGNVRELKNVIEVALAYDEGKQLDLLAHVGRAPSELPVETSTYDEVRARMEGAYFRKLYADTQGNVSEIARRSGLDRKVVRRYLARYGIKRPQVGSDGPHG